MDFALRFLNGRGLLLLGAIVIAVILADRYQEYPRRLFSQRPASAARTTSPLAIEIDSDLERKESARLRLLHHLILEEISAAEKKGFDVSRLRAIDDQALALDSKPYRAAAFERLQKLRLVIPQTVEPFRPASEDEESSDHLTAPSSRPTARSKKRSKN